MKVKNKHILDEWSDKIATELATRRFYDINECKIYAKQIMQICMEKILENQACDIENEIAELVKIKTGANEKNINPKIHNLKLKLKERRLILDRFEKENTFVELKKYVREKCGQDFLDNFFNNVVAIRRTNSKLSS